MRIVVGRGKNGVKRHIFERPAPSDRVGREQMAEDLKNYLFRPKLLERSA